MPDNQRAFPYGGIELARLYGAGQPSRRTTAGTPPAAFGVVVSDAAGRTVLASQHARAARCASCVRLAGRSSIRARIPRAVRRAVQPDRGARHRSRAGLRIRSAHRFTRNAIASRWQVTCTRRCRRYRVRAHFPTAGETPRSMPTAGTASRARLAGAGARSGARVALSHVALLTLGRGYRLIPISRPAGATLLAVPVAPQATNPSPGPSLAVELTGSGGFRERTLAVRIEPTASGVSTDRSRGSGRCAHAAAARDSS